MQTSHSLEWMQCVNAAGVPLHTAWQKKKKKAVVVQKIVLPDSLSLLLQHNPTSALPNLLYTSQHSYIILLYLSWFYTFYIYTVVLVYICRAQMVNEKPGLIWVPLLINQSLYMYFAVCLAIITIKDKHFPNPKYYKMLCSVLTSDKSFNASICNSNLTFWIVFYCFTGTSINTQHSKKSPLYLFYQKAVFSVEAPKDCNAHYTIQ